MPPQTISFGTQTTFESSLAEVERKRLLKVSKRKKEKKKDKFCHISTQTEVDSNCADHNSYDAVGLREMARSQQDEPMNYYFNRGTGEPKSQANVTAVGCMAIPLPTVQADFRCQTYFPVDTADVAVMVDFLRSENGIAPQLQSFDPCDYDQYASNNDAGPSGFDSFEDDFGGISSNIETQTDMRELAELFANDLPSPIHMETQTGGLEGYIDLNDIQTQTNLIDFIDAGFHSSVETQTWVYPSTL